MIPLGLLFKRFLIFDPLGAVVFDKRALVGLVRRWNGDGPLGLFDLTASHVTIG